MNKNKKKQGGGVSAIISIVVVLIVLYSAIPEMTKRRLQHLISGRGAPNQDMIIFAGFFVLVVLLIIGTAVLMFRVLSKKPAEREKPNPSARQDQAKAGTLQTLAAHIRQERKSVGEEAIHCAHLTGREKYMEQINSFLKNGLIDRAEYNALRERYSKLNIPDDYHG